jgi:predicted O-methyltransferase YrrM
MKNDAKYDVIVIDGIYRVSCSQIASNLLKNGGIIILDNSDWHTTAAGILRGKGFLQVDMFGFGPINDYTWATSLFFDRGFAMKTKSEIQPKHGIGSLKHEDTIE